MKLVASSKLRKAQRAIESLRPYEETLNSILAAVGSPALLTTVSNGSKKVENVPEMEEKQSNWNKNGDFAPEDDVKPLTTVVIPFASNSSMCGAFNANVIKKTLAVLKEVEGQVELWTFGRKVAEGMRKAGRPASRDFMHLVSHPDFEKVADLASELRELRKDGEVGDVILVYNRFISTGKQEIVAEHWGATVPSGVADSEEDTDDKAFILEPSRESLLESLAPQVEDLQLYAALLDSVASEHAARMVAMQAATDNGESLLAELTLEYNKGRQQKITSEILDLVAGAEN
jgi:F-type H+-transporting ATPase subunit gamma